MNRLVVLLLLLLLWLSPRLAEAQLSVIDSANLVFNTLTSVQTTLTVANQLIDLLPVDAVIGQDAAMTLSRVSNALTYLGQEGQLHFLHDFEQFARDFELFYPSGSTLPCTQEAARKWRSQAQHQARVSAKDAMRGQGTIWGVDYGVIYLTRLFDTLLAIIGNLQGHHLSQQTQAMIMRFQAHHQTTTMLMDRAQSSVIAEKATEAAIFDCLREKSLETWGSR